MQLTAAYFFIDNKSVLLVLMYIFTEK